MLVIHNSLSVEKVQHNRHLINLLLRDRMALSIKDINYNCHNSRIHSRISYSTLDNMHQPTVWDRCIDHGQIPNNGMPISISFRPPLDLPAGKLPPEVCIHHGRHFPRLATSLSPAKNHNFTHAPPPKNFTPITGALNLTGNK